MIQAAEPIAHLSFEVPGEGRVALAARHGVVAGWTGRNPDAIAHHIEELAAIGVPRPSRVPLYYRVAVQQFVQTEAIEVVGPETSGEAEPVLFDTGGALYLGLGSDHTDRALEAHSVALSKQACAKPLALGAWRFAEVADHVEQIRVRSFIREGAGGADWTPYQDGTLGAIRPLVELMAGSPLAAGQERLHAGTVMLCGTFPVLSGGVRPAVAFRMEMHDPILDRRLSHVYAVHPLPLVA